MFCNVQSQKKKTSMFKEFHLIYYTQNFRCRMGLPSGFPEFMAECLKKVLISTLYR